MYHLAMAAGALTLALAAQPAAAVSFSMFQDGWSEGATLTGIVRGTDLNNDDLLTGDETTELSLSFSGNSLFPAVSGLAISSFSYDLTGGALLGDQETELIIGFTFMFIGAAADGAPLRDCTSPPTLNCGSLFGFAFGSGNDFTQNPMTLTAIPDLPEVPLPAPLGLALLGLGSLVALGSRRRRSAERRRG